MGKGIRRMTMQEMVSAVMSSQGKKGGRARALALTPEQRSYIARKAGRASGTARMGKKRGPYRVKKKTAK